MTPPTATADPRHLVQVQDYVAFRRDGYLVVPGLLPASDVAELNRHVDALLAGRVQFPAERTYDADFAAAKERDQINRMHMLHLYLEVYERFFLHPRVLDVLEALIGPDVLALQTMLFAKGPGSPGQGWHQDSYYIPTFPDTLAAAWMPLERVDEENGCLLVTPGTQHEPIFPDADDRPGYGGDPGLADIKGLYGASAGDEAVNGLTPIARQYDREVPLVLEPGDVAFFGGHLLHRSLRNRSATRSRKAFVTHYCNARSFVPWHDDWSEPRVEGEGYNRKHILARGSTHLPYAQPRFGTPCAANQPPEARPARRRPTSIMGSPDGLMAPAEHGDPERDH